MNPILDRIHDKKHFDTLKEYKMFESKIENLLEQGKIEEVSVEERQHPLLEEHWYKDLSSGEIYRYCPPEFPARGVWEKIE